MRPRVFLAGVFHETHTFLEGSTRWEDFSVRRGEELLSTAGDGSPLAAVVETAAACGWDLAPALDIRATPSATVDDEVIERFWDELQAAARTELDRGLDGVFLVLHGAMVSRSCADVEGEILEQLRNLPDGAGVPICGVIDLHANFSRRMAEHADGLIAYRENPHTDAHAAAGDAARLLDRMLRSGRRGRMVWSQPPIVWPPTGTGTGSDPMLALERMAREIEARLPDIAAVNVLGGFAFADTPDTGVSFSAVTFGDTEQARAELQRLSEWAVAHRELGNVADPPIASVMPGLKEHREGPIVLVEPADNVGGGAPGDGTGILRALVEHDVHNAAVVINDPDAVLQLAGLPKGTFKTLAIGGRGSRLDRGPLELTVELVSTSDGRFDLEDPHSHLASMHGTHIEMGACAVVRHRGVTILLTSRKTPPFDLGQLRSQGIEPEKLFVIGVKAAVAHRRAYDKIAKAMYWVDTPGPCSSNLCNFPYRQIRRPIFPLDM
ncbi:MAG: M81 family metallopeptidase [Planctomycetes bacterium]|nr:M81 family metallopeptidase [Planctomycetota bacterium]